MPTLEFLNKSASHGSLTLLMIGNASFLVPAISEIGWAASLIALLASCLWSFINHFIHSQCAVAPVAPLILKQCSSSPIEVLHLSHDQPFPYRPTTADTSEEPDYAPQRTAFRLEAGHGAARNKSSEELVVTTGTTSVTTKWDMFRLPGDLSIFVFLSFLGIHILENVCVLAAGGDPLSKRTLTYNCLSFLIYAGYFMMTLKLTNRASAVMIFIAGLSSVLFVADGAHSLQQSSLLPCDIATPLVHPHDPTRSARFEPRPDVEVPAGWSPNELSHTVILLMPVPTVTIPDKLEHNWVILNRPLRAGKQYAPYYNPDAALPTAAPRAVITQHSVSCSNVTCTQKPDPPVTAPAMDRELCYTAPIPFRAGGTAMDDHWTLPVGLLMGLIPIVHNWFDDSHSSFQIRKVALWNSFFYAQVAVMVFGFSFMLIYTETSQLQVACGCVVSMVCAYGLYNRATLAMQEAILRLLPTLPHSEMFALGFQFLFVCGMHLYVQPTIVMTAGAAVTAALVVCGIVPSVLRATMNVQFVEDDAFVRPVVGVLPRHLSSKYRWTTFAVYGNCALLLAFASTYFYYFHEHLSHFAY